MNTLKHINLLVLLMLLFISAYSQSEPQEENYQQLRNTMTLEQQSRYNLTGFEGRAVQKTKDLAGYLEIISNNEYDLTLRKYALSMAVKLFYNNTITIGNTDYNISSLKIIDLKNYLDLFLNTNYTKIVVEISNCEFNENLRSDKSDSYTGKLKFNQTNEYYDNKTISGKNTEIKEVDIILVKTTKDFGKKSQNVWNVFLGEIRTIKE